MDEKLGLLAKCTVFARCSRRELTELGRLVEVSTVPAGAALPASARGRWTYLVLGGSGLAVTHGLAQWVLDEGDVWSSPRSSGSQPGGLNGDRLVALTELTVAAVESRALAAVERYCSSVARARRVHAVLSSSFEQISSMSAEGNQELVGSRSHG